MTAAFSTVPNAAKASRMSASVALKERSIRVSIYFNFERLNYYKGPKEKVPKEGG
jgi:hypothetical protein